MRVVGIDISTYTGMGCVDNGETYGSKLIHFPKAKGFDRVQLIAKSVKNVVAEWTPDLIVIEDYAFGNKNSLVDLVEIGTGIRLGLKELGHSWWLVPPTSLKLFITGKGNAKKPQMAAAVKERWGFESKSDDVVDGYALARLGEHIAKSDFLILPKGVFHAS
jgi:crossover junction endodeoxyribonuclease RuvC